MGMLGGRLVNEPVIRTTLSLILVRISSEMWMSAMVCITELLAVVEAA